MFDSNETQNENNKKFKMKPAKIGLVFVQFQKTKTPAVKNGKLSKKRCRIHRFDRKTSTHPEMNK